jgi:hypothetical protein
MLGFWMALAGSCLLLAPGMVAASRASRPGTLDRPTHRGWTWMAVASLAGSGLLTLVAVAQGPVGEVLI